MMSLFAKWLEDKPYRFSILNIIGLTILLTLAESIQLFLYVGGVTAGLVAIYSIFHALNLTIRHKIAYHPYHLALLWLPGAVAVLLTAASLYLIARANVTDSLAFFFGAALYGFQVSMLVILGAELSGKNTSPLSFLKG